MRQRRQEKQSRSIMAQLQTEACSFMKTMNTIAKGVADVVETVSGILYACPLVVIAWPSLLR